MTDVLVCLKRVPDSSSEVVLTPDAQAVDGRFSGWTVSPHENCAVELAIRIAQDTGGSATVLTLGPEDAVDQLRGALALGCTGAVHIVAESAAYGPADVAREIAAVVASHEDEGRTYDLVLLGNDASDSGDFQVGVRLSYLLDRPVVGGVNLVTVEGSEVAAVGEGADGRETYQVPLPAVVAVMEGGVDPRYPTVSGRMKAKKIEIETRSPVAEPSGAVRERLTLPPPAPSSVQVLGEGVEAVPALREVLVNLGVVK